MQLKNKFLSITILLIFLPLVSKAAVKNYQAQRTSQSYPYIINLEPGKAITFWVKFKNTGKNSWYNYGSKKVVLRHRGVKVKSDFYHKFWLNGKDAALMSEKIVKPGQEGTLKFALAAPSEGGLYWVKLDLIAGEENIEGGNIEVPIRVLAPTPIKNTQAIENNSTPSSNSNITNSQTPSSTANTYEIPNFDSSEIKEDTSLLNQQEPIVRVALYNTQESVKIKANGAYEIRDKDNNLLVNQTGGEESEIVFDFNLARQFLNIAGQRILSTDSYLRFIPKDEQTILEISSYKNPPDWNQNLNDNQFRGILETRYADPSTGGSGKFWVINELKMENYLKGLAEASDVSPLEFLKALTVAARTYATYYAQDPVKHGIFTVTATEGDQVYRGYGLEKRAPNITQAVNETKGMIVTYNKAIVITPYFSQSDGRTRSWSEVWSGSKPWLVSKPDPYCQGKTLLGHGVGMSSRGALLLAKDGKNFGQIVKYYYTGVEIKKVY